MAGLGTALQGFMEGYKAQKDSAQAAEDDRIRREFNLAKIDELKHKNLGSEMENATKAAALNKADEGYQHELADFGVKNQAWIDGGKQGDAPVAPKPKYGYAISKTTVPPKQFNELHWGMETEDEHKAGGIAGLWASVGRGVHGMLGHDTKDWEHVGANSGYASTNPDKAEIARLQEQLKAARTPQAGMTPAGGAVPTPRPPETPTTMWGNPRVLPPPTIQ